MANVKITIPDMGDFKDVEIIEILVKEGQSININDSLITLESDKSSVEVPTTHSGVIKKINLKVGDKVNQGDLILTLDTIKKEEQQTSKIEKEKKEIKKTIKKEQIEVPILTTSQGKVKSASPIVRKFARELGANIVQITGSQRAGRISEEDVKNFVKSQVSVNGGKVEKKNYHNQAKLKHVEALSKI